MFEVRNIEVLGGTCSTCNKPSTFCVIGDEEMSSGADKKLCASCALKVFQIDMKNWEKYHKNEVEATEGKLTRQGNELRRMIAMLEARLAVKDKK